MDKTEWLENNYQVKIDQNIIQSFGRELKQEFNSQCEEYGGWDGSYTSPKKGQIQYSIQDSAENNVSYMLNVPKYSVTIYRFCNL
ncbi:1,4-alpha-glucan branching enzyme [Cryptosporidium hominis TU502]|nr:1,4-alpha-glucan branching enzyme [Cryptosporidium hominis TU502]